MIETPKALLRENLVVQLQMRSVCLTDIIHIQRCPWPYTMNPVNALPPAARSGVQVEKLL